MKIKDAVLTAAGTFLVIVGAYMSIQIGPVPIVLTNFVILLVGFLLGWKRALVIMGTYMILGAIGLPVFSGGTGGFAHITGLTGGFLLSFIALAFIAGLVADKATWIKFLAGIGGSVLVYLIGVPWAMYVYNNIIAPAGEKPLWDLATTLKYTAIPFLFPDFLKVVAAVILSRMIAPVVDTFIAKK